MLWLVKHSDILAMMNQRQLIITFYLTLAGPRIRRVPFSIVHASQVARPVAVVEGEAGVAGVTVGKLC